MWYYRDVEFISNTHTNETYYCNHSCFYKSFFHFFSSTCLSKWDMTSEIRRNCVLFSTPESEFLPPRELWGRCPSQWEWNTRSKWKGGLSGNACRAEDVCVRDENIFPRYWRGNSRWSRWGYCFFWISWIWCRSYRYLDGEWRWRFEESPYLGETNCFRTDSRSMKCSGMTLKYRSWKFPSR